MLGSLLLDERVWVCVDVLELLVERRAGKVQDGVADFGGASCGLFLDLVEE